MPWLVMRFEVVAGKPKQDLRRVTTDDEIALAT